MLPLIKRIGGGNSDNKICSLKVQGNVGSQIQPSNTKDPDVKNISEQIPLPLDTATSSAPKPSNQNLERDTGDKPVATDDLARSVLKKFNTKRSRRVATRLFLIYQLIEMTLSLVVTL